MWPQPFDDARPPRPVIGPDVELTCRVIERILDDPQLAGEPITVEVHNRVVNLYGMVSTLYARVTTADLARSTPGVTDICNRLHLARSADVTTAMENLRPDPFDELIANWDDEPHRPDPARPAPSVKGRWLSAAAALMCVVAGVLSWCHCRRWPPGAWPSPRD